MKVRTSALAIVVTSCAVLACAPEDPITTADEALATGVHELGSLGGAGKCLDVAGAGSTDGTPLQQWTCNHTGAQRFRVDDLGGGLSRLVNPSTGKCVDVDGAGTADGTRIQLWTCNGTGAQAFQWVAGGGDVRLVNPHSGRCVDVDGARTSDGARVQLWTCNGTIAQRWHPRAVDAAPGLPAHVVAGYYPNWTSSPVRLRDVPAAYNVIYLFAARPEGGPPGTTGAVVWDAPGDGRGAATHLVEDIAYARQTQGRTLLLSVGGAGSGMSFPDRGKSQRFVDSIASLYDRLGGFDGLDWNTFEGSQAPDTAEMIWISLELKRRYPGFVITAPPAPWNQVDQAFCAAMAQAGALDYAAPQYYDGPGLDQPSYVVGNVAGWIDLLGASKVVVGFGVWDQPNYMSIGEAVSTWNQLAAAHPALRGAFDWSIHLDEQQGWPFATQVGPLVR